MTPGKSKTSMVTANPDRGNRIKAMQQHFPALNHPPTDPFADHAR